MHSGESFSISINIGGKKSEIGNIPIVVEFNATFLKEHAAYFFPILCGKKEQVKIRVNWTDFKEN